VRERHARLFQQNARIALVGKMAAAREVNHDGAGEREQQKRDINIPASPQRPADHAGPAPAPPGLAVGQCAGHTRDEHEHFRGIAEAVVTQRQPAPDVVGDMVKKDAPEHDAAAGINAQIAAVTFQLRQRAYQWLRGGSSIMHLVAPSGVRAASRGTEFDKKHRRRTAGS
jgi:hypothetical protein